MLAASCSIISPKQGIAYQTVRAPATVVTVGGVTVPDPTPQGLAAALDRERLRLGQGGTGCGGHRAHHCGDACCCPRLSGATYGPVAALLAEMFPPRIRYSSMSIPYHIGCGYFGGFLPFISEYVVARTGNPYSGLVVYLDRRRDRAGSDGVVAGRAPAGRTRPP